MLASSAPTSRLRQDADVLDLPAHVGDRLDDPPPLRGRLADRAPSSRSTGAVVSRRTGPIAMPGRRRQRARRGDGRRVRRRDRRLASSVSSNRRSASASRCSTASCACGPEARTSTSWPRSAPSVATRLRLPAGTGPAPVVRLRSCDGGVEAAHLADQPGGRPGVQAVRVRRP